MAKTQNPKEILLAASLDHETAASLETAFWTMDAICFARVLFQMQEKVPHAVAAALLQDKVLSVNPANTLEQTIAKAHEAVMDSFWRNVGKTGAIQ